MKIVLIGSGNLATNLGISLSKTNNKISLVYSRNIKHALLLAEKLQCPYVSTLDEIPSDADLYIISISDDAIIHVLQKIKVKNGIVVHTSGSVDISILKCFADNYGVFYPLMKFSKEKPIGFQNVPICLEASNTQTQTLLTEIAKSISQHVYLLNTTQRRLYHLAAVFVSNFVNFNYIIAEDVLKKNNLTFDLLHPIISETAKIATKESPSKIQTGPAIREDFQTIDEHLKLLNSFPNYKEIYRILTDLIIKKKKNEL